MIQTIKKLLLTSRPVSWPNTAYPFAAGYLVSGGVIDMTFVVGTFYFLIPYNLLMYGVNDVFDYESDIRNPRKGGLEGAVEQKAFHPTILRAALLSNLPFVGFLVLRGSTVSNLVLTTLLFFVIAYSAAKLRFKEIPVLDSVTSSIHFVGPLIFALSLINFSSAYMPFIIAFLLWGMASHAFGAIQDIIPDRQAGLSSVATALGAQLTARIVFLFYLVSSLILFLQNQPAYIAGLVGLLYVLNTAPYIHINDKSSGKTNSAWRRFIWLNLFSGFVITMLLLFTFVSGK